MNLLKGKCFGIVVVSKSRKVGIILYDNFVISNIFPFPTMRIFCLKRLNKIILIENKN